MLLRSVVEVALDPASLRVRGGPHSGSRGAQLAGLQLELVQGGLERRAEMDVVEREADLPGERGQHLFLLVGEGHLLRALYHDEAEQLARVSDRCGSECRLFALGQHPGQPYAQPRGARHARARDDRFLRGREDQACPTDVGVGGGPLEQPARSRPDLGRLQYQRLSERLGELEEQLVEWERARQPAAECAKGLAGRIALGAREPVREAGQPPAERLVEQGCNRGRGH